MKTLIALLLLAGSAAAAPRQRPVILHGPPPAGLPNWSITRRAFQPWAPWAAIRISPIVWIEGVPVVFFLP